MKYFEIRSDLINNNRIYGVIIYDESTDEYIAELPDDLEYNDAPMLLDSVILKGRRTVGPYITGLWIKERVIPSYRQNIGMILKANKMDCYDEFKLLKLSDGRCAQDDFYLKLYRLEVEHENILVRNNWGIFPSVRRGIPRRGGR